MFCPNCGHQAEEGNSICTNCEAQLTTEQHAATADPSGDSVTPKPPAVENQEQANTEPAKPNEFVETLKRESANFGHFSLNMLKGPDEARKINHTSMTPAIITMVIFSLFIALGTYLAGRQVSFFAQYSFLDSFLIPFVQFLILFAIVIALTFAGVKMAAQSLSFTDVIAKVGAYTIPFLALTIVGTLLSLIGLSFLASLVLLGLLGPILLVPTFVLLEQPANGFDRIYVLFGIYIVSLFVSGFLIKSIMNIFMGGMMESIMGGLF